MILIDTNIVSEVMRPSPASTVVNWLNNQDSQRLYLSVISITEIGYGLRLLPNGSRRHQLSERFDHFVEAAFGQRVLNFDQKAAHAYADIMGHRKEIGRPMSVPDGQIAAVARAHGFAVATRNAKDFEMCDLQIINPFEG